MVFTLSERCQICGIKALKQNFRKQDCARPRLDVSFQNFIILFQYGYCLPFDKPLRAALMIMMTVLALITAELFVSSSIADLISAFQAPGNRSWSSLQIIHNSTFYKTNMAKLKSFSNRAETIFLFLNQCFSLF